MLKRITFALLLNCVLLGSAVAQEIPKASVQSVSVTITAAADGERVRVAGPASVVQLHVEVYDFSGVKLFDQEIRGGNVLDWHSQNGQGQRLAPGDYVCVVTAKSLSGKITQRIGAVSIGEKEARVAPANGAQLSPGQAQTIGPVEENSSWTVSGPDEPLTPTVIAHDGTDGQMIRGRGALTFRIGNFFTGNDREQMRLTEDGRLGIGTNDPRATLDVAGTIRAQRFVIAKPINPGNDRMTQAGISATDTLTTDSGDVQSLASGSGTKDRIAKWIDNAGTLGDSAITETAGGFVGIGTTVPGSKLVVSGNSATLPAASGIARFADSDGVQTAVFADAFGTNPIFNVRRANGTAAAPSAVQANQLLGVIGASGYGASAYTGTRARVGFFASENWTNTANGSHITFNTTANGAATAGGTERMRIDNNGNVGIGTTNPTFALHVVSSSSTAMYGRSNGLGGVAVDGYSENLNIGGIGVNGRSDGPGGIGVNGNSAGNGGWGVLGRGGNAGVFGISTGGNGVEGRSHSGMGVSGYSDEGIGLFGRSTFGYAGHFLGRVSISGSVGIGTITPAAMLEVRGDIRLGSNGELRAAAGEENLRIIRGTVAADGTIIAGSGFTVSVPATGVYNITFTKPFVGSVPTITATPELTSTTAIIMTDGADANFVTLKVFRRSDGAVSSEAFHFIAIGTR
jgi:hypothetical protein